MSHEMRQVVAVKEVIKRVLLGETLKSAISDVEDEMEYGDRLRDLYRDNVSDLIHEVARELVLLKKIPPQDAAERVEHVLSKRVKYSTAQSGITRP